MKRMLFRIIVFSAVIFQGNLLRGQFYSTGEAPASLVWKKIQTPHFNIIFPEVWSDNAQKLAGHLESNFASGMGDLAHPFRKRFPVLIHSSSVQSNGYVTLAPRRMELVSTPPQDSYAQDWLSQLSLHEFRHVVQLNKLNQGVTRIAGWFTGEALRGIVSSQIPPWFYEGDAVHNETELSGSGRGRLPAFEMPLRTVLVTEPSLYSYNKAVFGSYRDFVPDHYQYGYPMVKFARSHFGSDIWSKAVNYTARNPYMIWPLAIHLMHNYGIDKAKLYRLTMTSLKEKYSNEIKSITSIKYVNINRRKDRVYTSWNLPMIYGDQGIIALKTGWNEPAGFVHIDSAGTENRIVTIGNSSKIKYDLAGDLLVWDEIVRDPRWERRDFSVLRIMDLKTRKQKFLTRKSRYFSPDFSPDGTRIAVVENDVTGKSFLTILDSDNGNVLQRIPATGRELVTPEWASANEILAITITPDGKQLEAVNTLTGQWKVYISVTKIDIAEPLNFGNFILFRGSFNNTDQIYALRKSSPKDLYQITRAVFGARQPFLAHDGRDLIFSQYGNNGFDVCFTRIDTNLWKKPDIEVLQHGNRDVSPDSVNNPIYPVTPYRKGSHVFRVHSWLPFSTDIDALIENPMDVSVTPGFMLFSQNLLSTVISSIGYSYNQGYPQFRPSLTLRGWYPVVEITAVSGGPQRILSLPHGLAKPDLPAYQEISLITYIPLFYTSGAYISQIQPRLEYEWTSTRYEKEGQLKYGLDYLNLKFVASRYRRFALRDLYPRWGQSLSLSYTQPLTQTGQFGTLFSVQTGLFFPGWFRHHHFFIRGGYQQQFPQKYLLPILRVDFPRGYTTAVALKTAGLMINYAFPVAYPDLSIGPVAYFKRVRAALFFDSLYGFEIREFGPEGVEPYTGFYRSYGGEILADMHLLRIIFPFSAGIRLGYLHDKNKWFAEFLMRMDTRFF